MYCLSCGEGMIQGGCHTFEECDIDGIGLVHNFNCSSCESHALFYEVFTISSCEQCEGSGYSIDMPCSVCKGLGLK